MEEDPAVQHAAYGVPAPSGALQHGRCCRHRQFFKLACAGVGRIDDDTRHPLYRRAHRHGQRSQRARRSVPRCQAEARHHRDGAHLVYTLYPCGGHNCRCVLRFGASHANAHTYKGRADRRCGALFPHIRARNARARYIQLR